MSLDEALECVAALLQRLTGHKDLGLVGSARPSCTLSGRSRLVPQLANTPVTLPQQLAQVIVTERGIADLRGRSLGERERLLRAISD
jgi:hypothetical protein